MLTFSSNCAAQLGVYFKFMQHLSSVDLAFLMNVVGVLTAIPEAVFPGYNGQCTENPADFFTSVLDVLVNQEKEGHGVSSGQSEDAGVVESLFGKGTIGQQVSTCYREHVFLETHASQVKCLGCGHASTEYAPFCSPLNITVPPTPGKVTLHDCLDLFALKSDCEAKCCEKHTKAESNRFFGNTPKYLVVEFDHIYDESDDADVIHANLEVPTEPIDLSRWSKNAEGASNWYEASAIVRRSLTK